MDHNKYVKMMNEAHNTPLMRNALSHLITTYKLMSPDLMAQSALQSRIARLRANGKDDFEIIRNVTATLLEGMTTGQWPDELGV